MIKMYINSELPIDENYPESSVYWIHIKGVHTDPRKEGYVGVSVQGTHSRFRAHKSSAKKGSEYPVHRAIRKYGDMIEVTTLVKACPEFCLLMEEMLRPEPCMKGCWNINKGGEKTALGFRHSEETKKFLSKLWLGKKHSEETKQKLRKPKAKGHGEKVSKALKGVKKSESHVASMSKCMKLKHENVSPWENYRALPLAWSLAEEINKYIKDFPSHSTGKIAKNFNLGSRSFVVTICANLKAGWNPLEDAKYLAWLEEYKSKQGEINGA